LIKLRQEVDFSYDNDSDSEVGTYLYIEKECMLRPGQEKENAKRNEFMRRCKQFTKDLEASMRKAKSEVSNVPLPAIMDSLKLILAELREHNRLKKIELAIQRAAVGLTCAMNGYDIDILIGWVRCSRR
jgi:hypothetical protein